MAYHHGSLREAAIAAAVALVDEGSTEVGLRELGRRLGVSHTAIRHHFPTIERLIAELVARWFSDLDRAMGAAVKRVPSTEPITRFRVLGTAYVRYALDHPHRFRLQFRAGPSGLVPEADASFRRVLETVVMCLAVSRRPVDPLVTTTLAWSAMHGLATLWIEGAFRNRLDRGGMEALTDRITALIAQLIAPA